MTILWYDGFDIYDNAADLTLNYLSGPGSIGTTAGRFGGGAWEAAAVGFGLSKSIPAVTELWVSGAIQVNNTGVGDRNVLSFFSASPTQGGTEGQLSHNVNTGVWKLWVGYQQTLLGSFTKSIAAGWHWIDVHYKYSGTVGIFEVWVDSVQQINLTGQNTEQNSGMSIIGYALGDGFGVTNCPLTWDDVVYNDASTGRIGDSRIETPTPNSDASPNDGTPSTGTDHFACVDALPWSSSKFITMANSSGDKEVYGQTGIVSTPSVVSAVKVTLISDKSDAGSFQLEPLMISNTTEGDGSGQQLTTTFGTQYTIFEHDPHTSAAWAYAAVNAATFGYKVP